MGDGHAQDHPGAGVRPAELIAIARALVSTQREKAKVPYRHQGRNLQGLDCIGLVIYVCQKAGILPAEFERSDYGRMPTPELVQRTALYCRRVEAVEPGLLALIRWPGEPGAGHAAICAGATLIHCDRDHGHVVEHGYVGHWVRLTDSLWRLPGVSYG